MPYVVGGVCVALGLHARRLPRRILWFTLATLTYETFLLPALWLVVFERPVPDGPGGRRRQYIRVGSCAIATVGLTAVARYIAALWVGPFAHLVVFSIPNASHRIDEALRFSFGLNTVVGWSSLFVLIGSSVEALRRPHIHGRRWQPYMWHLLLWPLGLLLCTAPYWLLQYSASRAVYGVQLAYGAGVIAMAWQAQAMVFRFKKSRSGCGGLLLCSLGQWASSKRGHLVVAITIGWPSRRWKADLWRNCDTVLCPACCTMRI